MILDQRPDRLGLDSHHCLIRAGNFKRRAEHSLRRGRIVVADPEAPPLPRIGRQGGDLAALRLSGHPIGVGAGTVERSQRGPHRLTFVSPAAKRSDDGARGTALQRLCYC